MRKRLSQCFNSYPIILPLSPFLAIYVSTVGMRRAQIWGHVVINLIINFYSNDTNRTSLLPIPRLYE